MVVPTAPSIGLKKDGQPVPELNLASEFEQLRAAAGAGENALALFVVQRRGAGALGAVLAQHLVLLGRQFLAPLGVGFLDGIMDGGLAGHGRAPFVSALKMGLLPGRLHPPGKALPDDGLVRPSLATLPGA